MRTSPRLAFVVLAIAVAATGCSTRTANSPVTPEIYSADRASFIEQRAKQLVLRGAPKDQAVDAAAAEWAVQTPGITKRSETERWQTQQQFEKDLAKMQREAK